ncbi:hypothetical protein BH09BAC4_BH09BAC4_47060 [soil metagenome]
MKTFTVILLLGSLLAGCQTLDELTTKPIAAFTVSNDGCTAACTIAFINKSTDAIAYLWEFGDSTTSTQENPTKQFTVAGTYTVKLTATGKNASNSTQQTILIKTAFPEPETVAVPGGMFQMGSVNGGDTKPVQSQLVTNFRIGKYELTVKQYRDFCTNTGRSFPARPPSGDWIDDDPIVNVTWSDASAYCEWLSQKTGKRYRLPTEMEWEYAARGGQDFIYSGSNIADEVAWNSNGYSSSLVPAQVGKKKPNGYGAYDMSGNVEEWCSSYYGPYPFNAPNGPATGSTRVLRGGWGISFVSFCAVTTRRNLPETNKYWWTGFRVAQSN